MQGRNRESDVENGLVDTVGEGEGGMNRTSLIDIYTPPCVKQTAGGSLLYRTRNSAPCSVMTYRVGWEEVGGRLKGNGM